MNKFAKILSVVLSVSMVISVTVVMLVSAFAADVPTFALNKVSENDSQIVVSVDLVSGKFGNVKIQLKVSDKITKCSKAAKGDAYKAHCDAIEGTGVESSVVYTMTYSFAAAVTPDCATTGSMAVFTLDKASAATITKDDVQLVVSDIDANVVNNLPEAVTVTEPSVTDPSVTDPSVTDPSVTDPSVTEPSVTDPSVTDPSVTKPSVTDPSVTDPTVTKPSVTDPSVTDPTVTKPSVTDPSVTKPTDTTKPTATTKTTATTVAGDTTAPVTTVAAGTVSNPKTGDSITATVAIISLLAVSGAAVVALRKKED